MLLGASKWVTYSAGQESGSTNLQSQRVRKRLKIESDANIALLASRSAIIQSLLYEINFKLALGKWKTH